MAIPSDKLTPPVISPAAKPVPARQPSGRTNQGSSHRSNRKWAVALKGLLLPLTLLLLWQTASSRGWLSPTMLPSPILIAKEFWQLIITGELWLHLRVSVVRAALGFLLGGSLGLAFGLAVGLFRRAEHVFDPSIQMLRTIPHLAITPLFILWFGFGELSKVLLISLGAFFPLYVNTFLGVRSVDSKLFDVAKVLEFNRWKQLTKLVLPAALPNVLLGLRLSIGIAWLGLVVAELMGSSEGIGYMITDARQFSRTAVVFVGIMLFAVVGKLADSFVRLLENRLLRWRDSYKG
ncbi:ABC transporter permease [Paenibacillus swuensis]|uniref:ABC transporter permease n=1 Tax=Paenibacillus swuensis TaxID=1178515 RepID=A0A172TIS1_9BACL|nr:ABC transporter permease [Paenibacillus swuensis]ANE46955.1 ABC transporter permease [Paenibacillus swuensis]